MNTTSDRGGEGMGNPFAEDGEEVEVWEQNYNGHLAVMSVREPLEAGAEMSRVTVMGCHEGCTGGPESRGTTASISISVTPDADTDRVNIVRLLMAPDGARALAEELTVYADWAARHNAELHDYMDLRPSDG